MKSLAVLWEHIPHSLALKKKNYLNAVKLDKTTLELQVNGHETLTATVEPANASVKIVSWNSSNEGVAKVSTRC